MQMQFYISQSTAWLCGDCATENQIWPLPSCSTIDTFHSFASFSAFHFDFVSSTPSLFLNQIPQKDPYKQLAFIVGWLLVTIAARAQRPLGTDVSGYQTNLDWVATKNGGVSFAWAKATEGASFTN